MADTAKPVIAGLAVGIVFIIVFTIMADNILISNDDSVHMLSSDKNDQTVPDNFKMVYSYGIGFDYTLAVDDTRIGTFTAENCYSFVPSQHATLAFSEQELESIWKAVNENDFFSLGDLTEQCPPAAASCIIRAPEGKAELQITAGDKTNMVEFHQNYELNHNTAELKRFKAIVSEIEQAPSRYDNLPKSDCAYA